ncbi:MAG: hypothetical protein WDA17_03920 [Sphaerochaetaceae bacterium]
MKLIEKIAYISFWINIFFVIFVYVGMPILFINVPDFFETWTANKGRNPLNTTFSILSLAVFFHWGYCIWFLFKYDRYSKSIFPLFFLNAIYAPIYYYRVKIKKRPLRNKIIKPKEIETDTEDQSISEDEFIKLNRENIIGLLKLWSSKEEQLEYQKSFPIAQVSSELFEQWDDFYTADSEVLSEAFNEHELDLLNKFDSELTDIGEKLKGETPQIEEFIKTSEWQKMNLLAQKILIDLK